MTRGFRLYTIGYRDAKEGKRREPEEFFQSLPSDAAVVDVRSHPYSPFCPPFTGKGVQAAVNRWKHGVNAFHHLRALGNTRREGSGKRISPPSYFDPESGFPALQGLIEKYRSVVIFCACSLNTIRNPRYRCHRFFVAEEMQGRMADLDVVHLP